MAKTRKDTVAKIAKTISEVSEQTWSRSSKPRIAITIDGLFAALKMAKGGIFEDTRIAGDVKTYLEQRWGLQCDNIVVTLAWMPGEEDVQ